MCGSRNRALSGAGAQSHLQVIVDPLDCRDRIDYELLVMETGVADMRDYLDNRSQGKFGQHVYERAPPGTGAAERKLYKRYQEYFGVRSEF